MQKGRINFLLGKYEDATAMLQEAAKGGESKAYYYLLETYLGMEDMTAAKTALEAYLDTNAADALELYDIAEDRIREERYELAAMCLEKAMRQKEIPNHRLVMRTLAITYEKQSDFAAAREVLTTYVNLYPEDEEAKKELTFLETR
jgi:tetratricopeptide (TPR) repeat protein